MSHQRLIKDTILTLIALVIFGSTNFIFNVVIGRVYGSAYLGAVSTALSTAFLLSYFVSTSFPGAVAKYTSEYIGKGEREKANYVLKSALVYGIIILGIVFLFAVLFAGWLSKSFNMPENLFLIATPIILIYGIYMILKMAYYGFGQVKVYFKNEIIADALFFMVLSTIVFFNFKNLVYLPYISLYFAFILIALYFFRDKLKVKIKDKKVRNKMLTFAGISFVGTFSSMSMRSLAIMISSIYVPHSDVGYLSAAMALSGIFFLFPNAIGRVFMPEFSRKFGEGKREEMIKLLNRSTEYLAVMVTIVDSLGMIFAFLLIRIFYSYEYKPSIFLLQILLLGFWFTMVGRPCVSVLSGTKYVHHPNIGGVLGLLAALISWFFFIPLFGIVGAGIGYFIGVFVTMNYIFFFAHKLFDFQHSIIFKHWVWSLGMFVISIVDFPLSFKAILLIVFFGSYLFFVRDNMLRMLKREWYSILK